jgi:hypothetical protein
LEADMMKKICLALAVLVLSLFLVSCANLKYEAYVTIVNIGNMPMDAWVDGDGTEIPAYDSVTWAITLETKNEVRQLFLEAEPSGGGDHDEITVNLHGDRDIVTWLTGWDAVQNAGPQKKESSVVYGPASAAQLLQ